MLREALNALENKIGLHDRALCIHILGTWDTAEQSRYASKEYK